MSLVTLPNRERQTEPATSSLKVPFWRKISRFDLIVLTLFGLAAGFVTARLWGHPRTRLLINEQDQIFFQWVLAHGARVARGAQYPFFTELLNAPDGVNLMANTSVLGLGVPLAPITWIFGAEVSFIVALTAGLCGTAFAWYWVLSRHVVTSRVAAAVGGLFCGFAPGMISQAQGHPNLIAQFVVPFIVWRVLCLAEEGRAVRNGVILGLLVTYQAFVNEEVLLFTALACGAFLALWALQRRVFPLVFVKGLAVAGAVAVVLLAYPLWVQFFGPMHYSGLKHGYQPGADLASFTAYGKQALISRGFQSPASVHFAEETTFFGWPLFALLMLIVVFLWRDVVARSLALTGLGFALVALGPVITIKGNPTGIKGPWAALDQLPLFDSVIPVRFGLVLTPIVGVLLALATDKVLKMPAGSLPIRGLWAGVLVAALLPSMPTPLEITRQEPVPHFISAGTWRQYVEPGHTLVPVPLPTYPRPEGMRWAAVANLEFALPRGYYLGPRDGVAGSSAQFGAPERPTSTLLEKVATTGKVPAIDATDRQAAQEDLDYWKASVVVLDPAHRHTGHLLDTLVQLLGPPTKVDDVWLWKVVKP
ncbi:MAG TPA: hypothetical protein VF062_29775 [Candidatus Limnocylindrales bacterium]